MSKRSVAMLALALALTLSPVSAFAKKSSEPVSVLPQSYTVVHEAKGDPNAKVEFIDPKLVPLASSATPSKGITDSGIVTPMGNIIEVYDHSYYVVDYNQITSYNCGPIDSQKFLISVARGQTKTLSSSTTISGSVSYTSNVSADVMKIINLSLTFNVSGSVSHTWGTTDVYTGPDSSSYSHRDYYGANQYDEYSNVVHRYDVYKVYNGSAYMYNETIDAGTTTYYAKKPKQITYSMDF